MRCLDLRASMRNRRQKNRTPVEKPVPGECLLLRPGCKYSPCQPCKPNPVNPSVEEQWSPLQASLCLVHVHQCKHIVRSLLLAISLLFFNESKQKKTPHRNQITWATFKAKSSWGQSDFSWTANGVKFNLQLPKCLNYSYVWHNKDLVLAVVACLIHS